MANAEEHSSSKGKAARILKAHALSQEWFHIEPGRSLVDELMAERRAEAAKETQEEEDEFTNQNRI